MRIRRLLGGIPAASIHNGGRLAFGPDGMLYATAGDAGNGANAQNLNSLGGKILRMTATGGVPADNPFTASYVYSYGHRNPQGIAWNADGAMYASEFGQNTWDELNLIKAGGNYGWPVVEGKAGDSRYIDPLQQWATADASPSGIAISKGQLYIANLRGQRLRQIALTTPGSATERYVGQYGRLRDVVVTPDGVLWMLTNNTDGRGTPGPGDDRIVAIPDN
jgi:glucose/arabinose dehydrogenase